MLEVPFWQVNLGSEAETRVLEIVRNRQFSMGKETAKMEDKVSDLLNVKRTIGVTSGSDAILMSLIALGVGPGKKILLQDRSWVAAANALGILGAKIILVDVEANSNKLNLDDLERKHEEGVMGVIVVQMNGGAPDMNRLSKFCSQKGIFLLEDSAQAIGSQQNGKYLGTFGNTGCFSLSMTKIVASGQGGFIVTNDDLLANRMEKIRLHGNKEVFAPDWDELGFNFRLTDLHAAIANTQLDKLEERKNLQKMIFLHYSNTLSNIEIGKLLHVDFESGQLGPYIEFILNEKICRKELISFCANVGIEVRPFYPSLIHTKHYLDVSGFTPEAIQLSETGVYLPAGPAILEQQIYRVCEALYSFEKQTNCK